MTANDPLMAEVRTGADLDAMDFPPLVARDLLTFGDCSPTCLLALVDDAPCSCRCDGKWHGALVDAEIPAAAIIRPLGRQETP